MSKPSKSTSIKHLSLAQKPRERGKLYGYHNLTDTELLAILLRTGTRSLSVLQLAQQILAKTKGEVHTLFSLSVEDLLQIEGVGLAKSATICACAELARRASVVGHSKVPKLNKPKDIVDYIRLEYSGLKQEVLRGIYLDTKKKLLKDVVLSRGGLNFAYLSAREIFFPAMEAFADAFVLVHNHPSGDATPSRDDRSLTRSIYEMGKLLKIPLVDHIILSQNSYYSFAEKGELL